MTKKATEDVWKDCTDSLSEDFEKLLASLRSDSRKPIQASRADSLIERQTSY